MREVPDKAQPDAADQTQPGGSLRAAARRECLAGRADPRLPPPHRRAEPEAERLHHRHAPNRHWPRLGKRKRNCRRARARTPSRDSDRPQGPRGYGRRAHHRGQRSLQGSRPHPGCRGGPPTSGRGRGAAGQAEHARVCVWRQLGGQLFRPGRESLGARLLRGRLVLRVGRGRRDGALLRRARLRHRWIHPSACGLLRHRGVEAHLWPGEHEGRDPPGLVPRPPGPHDANGAGCRPHASGDGGLRRGGPGQHGYRPRRLRRGAVGGDKGPADRHRAKPVLRGSSS